MKELAGILDSAVYKLLVTRLVPGFTALSTYLWLAALKSSAFQPTWKDFRLEVNLVVLFIASAAGLLIEDLGMKLENSYFKSLGEQLARGDPPRDPTAEWYLYLRTGFDLEPVGHGYLKQVLLLLKFEINMAIALAVASFGLLLIELPCPALVLSFALTWLVALFLGWHSAKESVDHLATLRFELLRGVRRAQADNADGGST